MNRFSRTATCLLLLVSAGTSHTHGQASNVEEVKIVMDRVLTYLNTATPVGIVDEKTGTPIADLKRPNANATLVKSEYRIETHEWGLTYSSMLLAFEVTGDPSYKEYVIKRMEFLARAVPYFKAYARDSPNVMLHWRSCSIPIPWMIQDHCVQR